MRIKNPLPPPLSVSPPPKPHSSHHIHQSIDSTKSLSHLPPPKSPDDMPHVMVSRINGRICSNNHVIYQDPEEEESTNEEIIFTATNQSSTAGTSAASSVSSSRHVVGRWCEEEKAYPLKKRRVSFERLLSQESLSFEKENNKNDMKGAVKCKKDEKKYWVNSEVENDSERKGRNESMVMKGLRCNRANGKGWRCRQQRLVGHTMCRYHVQKGTLRNPGQSRSLSESIYKRKKVKNFCDDDDGERFLVGKKRKRIGVVKARSMSSLLSQTVPLLPLSL